MREQLVEGIVVGDDALMERYLDGEMPSSDELEHTLATGVADGLVFPVVCGSATTGVGIDRLATLLAELAPPPGRSPVVVKAGDTTREVECDPGGTTARTGLQDDLRSLCGPHLACFGSSRGRSVPTRCSRIPRSHTDEKLHVLQVLRGKEAETASEAQAGDIVAVPEARRHGRRATPLRPRAPL